LDVPACCGESIGYLGRTTVSQETVDMSLARKLKDARDAAGLTLEELAQRAEVSKTYLWELEKDEAGEKKPSAEVLLRIANALSVTLADLLGLPTVKVKERKAVINPSLLEFKERMAKLGTPLTEQDVQELAAMSFRGGRPRSADEWHELYFALERMSKRGKHGEK
jgi:transcriptional regulator with XRE-family HTH domain